MKHVALLQNAAKEPPLTKIGIYPAAFDPVHAGHIAFADAAIKAHDLDKVFFVPEPTPRHKQGVKALSHRTEMLHLALTDHAQYGIIMLEKQQLSMQELWPMILSRFAQAELYMLLGSDAMHRMLSWPNIALYAASVPHFIVAKRKRNDAEMESLFKLLEETKKLDTAFSIIADETTEFNSQAIRTALKKGHTPSGLNPRVAHYIQEHRLYMSGAL